MTRVLGVVLFLIGMSLASTAVADEQVPVQPNDNQGQRWRIAYYQGGDYVDYKHALAALVRGLMALGWVDPTDVPEGEEVEIEGLWTWLAYQTGSRSLQFVADAFYDAGWDETRRAGVRESIIDRLSQSRPDIDLVIAMGTWAGQDLANERHATPVMVVSASDPINAGIVESADDSGLDHVHSQIDPERYTRQIRLFHDTIGFARLGIVYEDTLAGRSYAAVDHVERVARERGFELVRCHAVGDIPDVARAEANLMGCFERLLTESDAIYVTVHGGVTRRTLPQIVTKARARRIPTFSQHGADEAEEGLLLSMSMDNFRQVGLFHASAIARVLNGAKPRDLPMVFPEQARLAINLVTAHAVGFIPPAHLLAGADLLFHDEKQLP